jgi:hypothetical protein
LNSLSMLSDRHALAIVSILPVLFFFDIVVGNSMWFGDSSTMDYPVYHYYGKKLLQGYFPIWAPELNFGTPLFADIQSGLLYPPNILFSILGYTLGFRAWLFDILFHLSLAGSLLFLYGREARLSPVAALFWTLAIVSGGYYASHLGHTSYTHSLSYAGGMLFSVLRFANTGALRWVALYALFWLLSFLAGGMPAFFLLSVLCLTYALFFLADGDVRERVLRPRIVALSILIILGVFVIPAFLQLSATSVLYEMSARRQWPEAMYFGFHARLRTFWHLIFSDWFVYRPEPGSHETYAHSGSLVVFLAVYGMLVARFRIDATRAFWVFAIIVGAIFAHALNPVYYSVFKNVPGFGGFRVPGRYLLFVTFGLCFFAASGMDSLLSSTKPFRKKTRTIFFLLAALLFLLVVPFYKNDAMKPLADSVSKAFPDFVLIAFSLGALILIWFTSGKSRRFAVAFAFAVVLGGNYLATRSSLAPLMQARATACDENPGRCVPRDMPGIAPHNNALFHEQWGGVGLVTLEPFRTYQFKVAVVEESANLSRGLQDAGGYVYNGRAAPLAYFVNRAELVNDAGEILANLRKHSARCPLYIESDVSVDSRGLPAITESNEPSECLPVSITSGANPNEMILNLPERSSDGYLFVSQTYFPGWEAITDKASLPVFRANFNFVAVPVNVGTNSVKLVQRVYSGWLH